MKKVFAQIGRPFKSVWRWLRNKIIKWPASEAEAFLMSTAMLLSCIWFITYGKLVETQYVVEEKVRVIKEQAQTIETYKIRERTLHLPGKTKVVTVTDRQLQQAVKEAQQEAAAMRQAKQHYQDMARKYKKPATQVVNPAVRVTTEEKINDQFIQDWKSGQ